MPLDTPVDCAESNVGDGMRFFLDTLDVGVTISSIGSGSESESELESASTSSAFRFFDISSCLIFSESSVNLMCAFARSFACCSNRSRSHFSFPA